LDTLLWIFFVLWSLLGSLWFDYVPPRWVVFGYPVVHILLAGAIIWKSNHRLKSAGLCLIGLLVGEWNVVPLLWAFLAWSISGFAP
jgi:hypothetical protein